MTKTKFIYALLLFITINVSAGEKIKSWRFHNSYNASVKLAKAKKPMNLNLSYDAVLKKYYVELYIFREDVDVQRGKKCKLVTKKNVEIDLKFIRFEEAFDFKQAGYKYCYKWTFLLDGDAAKNEKLLSEVKLKTIKYGNTNVKYYWEIPIKNKKVFPQLLAAVKTEQSKKSDQVLSFTTALKDVNFMMNNSKVDYLEFIKSEKGKLFKPLHLDVGYKAAVYHDKLTFKPTNGNKIEVKIIEKKITGKTKNGVVIESTFEINGVKFVYIEDNKTYRIRLADELSYEFNFKNF